MTADQCRGLIDRRGLIHCRGLIYQALIQINVPFQGLINQTPTMYSANPSF